VNFPHPGTRVVANLQQGSRDWHEMRKGCITGTRAARILVDNGKEVMREMVRDHFGAVSEVFVTDAMKRGTKMEPVARNDFREETNKDVAEAGMVIHREYPWLRYSPDGLVNAFGVVDEVLEIKVPWDGLYEEIPPQYYQQCYIGMEVCGVKKSSLFIWNEEEVEIVDLVTPDGWWKDAEQKLLAFYAEYNNVIKDEARYREHLKPRVALMGSKEWKAAAKAWLKARRAADKAAEALEKAKADIINLSEGKSCAGAGVRAIVGDRAGQPVWRLSQDK
jgi:putative phage-type endonuclease